MQTSPGGVEHSGEGALLEEVVLQTEGFRNAAVAGASLVDAVAMLNVVAAAEEEVGRTGRRYCGLAYCTSPSS